MNQFQWEETGMSNKKWLSKGWKEKKEKERDLVI